MSPLHLSAPCDTVIVSPVMTKTFSRVRFENWKILYPVKNVDNKKVLPLYPEKSINQLIN
jgi:hypothetical protein